MTDTVAVVGGGLSGLVAAHEFAKAGASVRVFEAGDRWGGKIWSSEVGGVMVDAGPDNFLARVPEARELCEELGLGSELVSPVSPVPAYIRHGNELKRLPAGTVLGVPTDLNALRESGLISPEGVARAADDLTLPATPFSSATSVGEFCRARLGDEVTERLIDPLVGGINASDIDSLSLADGAPQLAAAAERSASLIEGLRMAAPSSGATLGSAGADNPVFVTVDGGLARLIGRLIEELGARGVELSLDAPVTDLGSLAAESDHVVVATEAHAAARLLATSAPAASGLLQQIEHASVSQVTVQLNRSDVDPVLDASGILFPRVDGLILTAATWFSTKWAHYSSEDSVMVRLTSGRFNDERAATLSDRALTTMLLAELGIVINITGAPTAVRTVRWPNAFPQYQPGHADLVAEIRSTLAAEIPKAHLVGNSYSGIGIPASTGLARRTVSNALTK